MNARNRMVCWLATMLLGATSLASCAVLVEPTSPPTDTPFQPTITPSPYTQPTDRATLLLPSPTATPVTPAPSATTAGQGTVSVSELLQTNGGCELPCWWGIQPGVTSWRDVQTQFGLPYEDGELQEGDLQLDGSTFRRGPVYGVDAQGRLDSLSPYVQLDFVEQKGTVQAIRVTSKSFIDPEPHFRQDWQRYALAQMLADYGQPSQVMLEIVPTLGPGSPPRYLLLVLYDHLGIAIRYEGAAFPKGSLYQVCPVFEQVGAISLWLQSPDWPTTLAQQVISPAAKLHYRALEQATGMDVETFYNTFKDPGNQACWEGEAADLFGLVFSSGIPGEIYRMSSDGQNVERLTYTESAELRVQASRDGRKVVFHRGGTRLDRELYLLDVESGDISQLTNWSGYDIARAWSPDGSQIAINSDRDGGYYWLYLMDADGSNQQRLPLATDQERAVSGVSWSPDGRYLVYTASEHIYAQERLTATLFIVELSTLEVSQLTDEKVHGGCFQPDWSWDGEWIAMVCTRGVSAGDYGEVYIIRPDGSEWRQITTKPAGYIPDYPAGTLQTWVGHPHWSPAGQQIVYATKVDRQLNTFIIGIDGQNNRQLTNYDYKRAGWGLSVYQLP